MKAVEFDKWFEGEMPNSHKKVNKERIETVIYSCAEAAWDFQQSKIDLLEVQLKGAEERAKLALDHKNRMVDDLQKQLRIEREQGTDYFTDFHNAIAQRDELQSRIRQGLKIAEDLMGEMQNYKLGESLENILKGNKDEN